MSAKKTNNTKLERAPIILAVCEIRYDDIETFDKISFKDLKNELKEYSTYEERVTGNIMLRDLIDEKVASIQNKKIDSHLFISDNKRRDFVVSQKKFDFSQHFNYIDWLDFILEVKKVWAILTKKVGALNIRGISLRYINKIEISELIEDPTEYFNTSIQVNDKINIPFISNYSIRYTVQYPDKNQRAIVQQSLEDFNKNSFQYIFDIDVHQDKLNTLDDSIIWKIFDDLRDLKNELFFNNLTEKTLNLIK